MFHWIKKYFESIYWTTYAYGKMRGYIQPMWSTKFNTHEILPNIFIGDIASACNQGELERLGVTHIVTAILGVDPKFPEKFEYINIPIRDIPTENINVYFNKSNKFISSALKGGGKVFVHCVCGVSRSATLLAAFMMEEYGMTCDEAIDRLKIKRQIVNPNKGFVDQLEKFSQELQDDRIEQFMKKATNYDAKTRKIRQRRRSL